MFVWSYLMASWWIYWGLLHRAFGNRLGSSISYQQAVSCFSRALAYAPNNARLYFWRGTLYWREFNDHQRAQADLTRAIELAPQMARAYLNRAFARWYALPPDRAGAVGDFQAFLARGEDPYWRTVAQQHLQQYESWQAANSPETPRNPR